MSRATMPLLPLCTLAVTVLLGLTGVCYAAGFNAPTDLPGLVLWLDASDATTVSDNPRGISEWRDKSGQGNHLSQPNPASCPTLARAKQNGLNVVSFDGATQFLTGPAVLPVRQAAYTIVAVWRPHRASGSQSVVEQATSPIAGNSRAALLAVGAAYGFNGESNDRHDLVPFTANAWRLTSLEVNNANPQNVRIVDNGSLYEGTTTAPAALQLGASGLTVGRKLATDGEYLEGDVAEIIICDRVLSRDDQQKLLAYLDHKWGLDCLGWFHAPDGRVLVFDFESETYGDWKAEGEAFGPGPAVGTLPGQMDVSGYQGKRLVNSFYKGDGTTGTLTGPPFVIERKYINFFIGGGMDPEKLRLDLLVDGKVVRTATGPNDKPGGTEKLDLAQWDVSDLVGKTATIQIVDQATGGWGHINVDNITQSDKRLPVLKDQAREIVAEKRYLNLPVKTGAPKRMMQVVVGGKAGATVAREFLIEPSDTPDFWVFMDLTPFKGQKLALKVAKVPEDSKFLSLIEQGDAIKTAEPIYSERLRPQFHYTNRRGWNNDANGLVYYAGEYHLFCQHNPYGVGWDNMHWNHAVSPDLVHWKELPEALYPDKWGAVFSGSAVVDEYNTLGVQKGAEKTLVCIYAAAGAECTQCLAYSTDRGRTWTKYAGNPVLPHVIGGNRDPKVIWYGNGPTPPAPRAPLPYREGRGERPSQGKWIMALFLDGNTYGLFTSSDLKKWEKMSEVTVPGTSECPEFFEIPLDGNKADTRWVFYGGNCGYLVGRFDGRTFTSETGTQRLSYGNCFYASQTYNNIPPQDGRRIQIAWGTVSIPGMPFDQMMDFPVELTRHTTPDGPRLFAVPAREIATLHGKAHAWQDKPLQARENPFAGIEGDLFHIAAEIKVGETGQLTFTIRGIPVTYDVATQTLSCRGCAAKMAPVNGSIRLQLLVDRASIEIFGNDGALYMPIGVIPAAKDRSLALGGKGGAMQAKSLEVWELKSAWR